MGTRKARAVMSDRREEPNRFVPRSMLPKEDSSSLQQESPTSAFQRGRPGRKENLSLLGGSTRKIRSQLGGPIRH